jgi:hypothetical protein
MNNLDNLVLGDMSSVREKSIHYLSDNYFWPVSDDDFSEFYKYMYIEYIKLVKSENNANINNIATVEFSFISNLIQILHYNYVREYSIKNGLNLVTGKDSEQYINPNWDNIKHYYSNLFFPHGKVVRMIRRFARNIIFNKNLPFVKLINGLIFGSDSVSIGSNDKTKKEFIRSKNKFYDHIDWPSLVIVDINPSDEIIAEYVKIFTTSIIDPYLKKISNHNSLFVKNVDFDRVKDVWLTRVFEAYLLYFSIKSSAKSSELLVTEMSKPIHKIITVAYQDSGCKVYGFHHGNDSAIHINKLLFSISISHCYNLVVPTNGIKDRYKKHYSNTYRISNMSTRFISVNSKEMYKIYSNNASISNVSDCDTVMIMGYPCNSGRYIGHRGLFFYQQVDLEFRLISLLKSKNKRIIYKAHPDRLEEVESVFNGIVDEIITEPFERVWNKADLLIFTYTSTTTFGFALTTNLPIVLLDSEEDMRDADDVELIDSRIIRVPSRIGADTRIYFENDKLIKAIAQSNYDIAYDYVKDIYR